MAILSILIGAALLLAPAADTFASPFDQPMSELSSSEPSGPIERMSLNQMMRFGTLPEVRREKDLADLHKLAREGRSEAEIKQLETAIATERATLASVKPDLEQMGARPIACMATFRIRAKEVGRTSF